MVAEPVSYARDIRPLFRDEDVEAMAFVFDLSSYEDVRENADDIYERLAEGTMPCDRAWPQEQVERFHRWMDAGLPP